MSAIRCVVYDLARTGAWFERKSLQENPCGSKLSDLDAHSDQILSRLEVLTSRPELLSETDIIRILDLLLQFRKLNKEVN